MKVFKIDRSYSNITIKEIYNECSSDKIVAQIPGHLAVELVVEIIKTSSKFERDMIWSKLNKEKLYVEISDQQKHRTKTY